MRAETIRIPNSRLKVQCRVYATQREMHQGIRKDVIGGIANSTLACCVHQTKSTIHDDRIAAVVFFSRTHLDPGTIAHEMLHAAWNVLERRRVMIQKTKKVEHLEEMLATVTGDLVEAFHKRMPL